MLSSSKSHFKKRRPAIAESSGGPLGGRWGGRQLHPPPRTLSPPSLPLLASAVRGNVREDANQCVKPGARSKRAVATRDEASRQTAPWWWWVAAAAVEWNGIQLCWWYGGQEGAGRWGGEDGRDLRVMQQGWLSH